MDRMQALVAAALLLAWPKPCGVREVAKYANLRRFSVLFLSAVMTRGLPSRGLLGVSVPFPDRVGRPIVGQHCGRSTRLLHSSRTPAPRMTRSGVARPSHSPGEGRVEGPSDYFSYLAMSPNHERTLRGRR